MKWGGGEKVCLVPCTAMSGASSGTIPTANTHSSCQQTPTRKQQRLSNLAQLFTSRIFSMKTTLAGLFLFIYLFAYLAVLGIELITFTVSYILNLSVYLSMIQDLSKLLCCSKWASTCHFSASTKEC